MRGLLLGSVISIVTLIPGSGNAGPLALQVDASNIDQPPSATSNYETYRGYVFDLSENSERRDVTAIADMLRHQLDVVESVGLSPKVLQFLHSIPIVASEMACLEEGAAAACYGQAVPERDRHASRELTTWDTAKGFAKTASIFLAGNDADHEPYTRAKLKEKQPDYFKYLVGLFGFDPDGSNLTPVASAN